MAKKVVKRLIYRTSRYQLYAPSKSHPDMPRDLQQVLDSLIDSPIFSRQNKDPYTEVRFDIKTNTALIIEYTDEYRIFAMGEESCVETLRKTKMEELKRAEQERELREDLKI